MLTPLSMEIVLTGILFVLSEGCSWRGIHRPGAHWNAIYQYYREWCRSGLWENLWQELHACAERHHGLRGCQPCESASVWPQPRRRPGNTGGGTHQGGWNTKIHAAVDGAGVPRVLLLSAGHEADVNHAQEVLESLDFKMAVLDKGYDSDPLRIWLFETGSDSLHSGQEQPLGLSGRANVRPATRSS